MLTRTARATPRSSTNHQTHEIGFNSFASVFLLLPGSIRMYRPRKYDEVHSIASIPLMMTPIILLLPASQAHEVDAFIRMADTDLSGTISQPEFLKACAKHLVMQVLPAPRWFLTVVFNRFWRVFQGPCEAPLHARDASVVSYRRFSEVFARGFVGQTPDPKP